MNIQNSLITFLMIFAFACAQDQGANRYGGETGKGADAEKEVDDPPTERERERESEVEEEEQHEEEEEPEPVVETEPEEEPEVEPEEPGYNPLNNCRVEGASDAAFQCVLDQLAGLRQGDNFKSSPARTDLEDSLVRVVENVETAREFFNDQSSGVNGTLWSPRVVLARTGLSSMAFAHVRALPAGSGSEGAGQLDPLVRRLQSLADMLAVIYEDR